VRLGVGGGGVRGWNGVWASSQGMFNSFYFKKKRAFKTKSLHFHVLGISEPTPWKVKNISAQSHRQISFLVYFIDFTTCNVLVMRFTGSSVITC
jgi:hypothetical protein